MGPRTIAHMRSPPIQLAAPLSSKPCARPSNQLRPLAANCATGRNTREGPPRWQARIAAHTESAKWATESAPVRRRVSGPGGNGRPFNLDRDRDKDRYGERERAPISRLSRGQRAWARSSLCPLQSGRVKPIQANFGPLLERRGGAQSRSPLDSRSDQIAAHLSLSLCLLASCKGADEPNFGV